MGQLSSKIIEMSEGSHLINHHYLSRRGNILDKEGKGDEEDAQRRHAPSSLPRENNNNKERRLGERKDNKSQKQDCYSIIYHTYGIPEHHHRLGHGGRVPCLR